MLCDALITPSPEVRPRVPLDMAFLTAIVRGLDHDGKDIPVLLRHYMKLGPRFHAVGVDPGFDRTPGLLLSVDVPQLQRKTVATFLGAEANAYLAHSHGASGQRE